MGEGKCLQRKQYGVVQQYGSNHIFQESGYPHGADGGDECLLKVAGNEESQENGADKGEKNGGGRVQAGSVREDIDHHSKAECPQHQSVGWNVRLELQYEVDV